MDARTVTCVKVILISVNMSGILFQQAFQFQSNILENLTEYNMSIMMCEENLKMDCPEQIYENNVVS